MSEELSYINSNGDTVHTSQYLKNRKSCCKTFCLHCPYGTTLEKHGLVFQKVENSPSALAEANTVISQSIGADTLGSSMIASAFGEKKVIKVSKFNYERFVFVSLKDNKFALARLKNEEVKEVFIKPFFNDQGIDLPLITQKYEESK